MPEVFPIIIVALLVITNGVFVAAEFALISTPRALIDQLATKGHALARVMQGIMKDRVLQDRYIATAQLGITLASLGLGMYGEHKLADWLAPQFEALGTGRFVAADTVAMVVAIGLLTYVHIVLGEMVPKSIALQKSHQTAFLVAPFVILTQKGLYPLIVGLNSLGNRVLSLCGIKPQELNHGESVHSAEELQFVIKESQEGGQLRQETGEVLQDLLNFAQMTAGEAMVPRIRIVGIPLGAAASEVREILSTTRHTRYPVYDGNFDNIVGIVHSKDFLKAGMMDRVVSRDMARPVPYVPESANLEQVLKRMRKQNAHMVVVIDEFGGTAGMLAIEDLFEEVVGEIGEGAGSAPDIHIDKNGVCHAKGIVRLMDLGERLELELGHEDVDTVSGLILLLLGRPPHLGDFVDYKGLRFAVTKVEGHGVGSASIALLPRKEAKPEEGLN
jgi:CBS domain containing-hemolysin-like protein